MNAKLEIWRNTLDQRIFRVKTEYMEWKFSKNVNVDDIIVKM